MRRGTSGSEQLEVGVPIILSGYDLHSLGIYRLIRGVPRIQRELLVILRYRPPVLSLFDSDGLNPIAHRWRLMSSGVSTTFSLQGNDANGYSRLHVIYHKSHSTTKICDIVRCSCIMDSTANVGSISEVDREGRGISLADQQQDMNSCPNRGHPKLLRLAE